MIRWLTFVDEHHFDDRIQWDIDLMRAHAIGSAIRGPIVAVTKLFRINLIVLRDEGSRW